MSKPKVILVAGHGGGDPGAVYQNKTEAVENIDIVNRTAKYMAEDGRVDVVIVPHSLNMMDGIYWINKQAGVLSDEILTFSVHKNMFDKPAYGYETFAGESVYQTDRMKALHGAIAKRSTLKDRGLKNHKTLYAAGLGFIRVTKFEAALGEFGFMHTDHYDNSKYALGLAEGIYKYFGLTLKRKAVTVANNTATKYYRVFDSKGKQLGAYASVANAWKKYKDVLDKGKITNWEGEDITGDVKDQYTKNLGTVTDKGHDELEKEIAKEFGETNEAVKANAEENTAQDKRLDKLDGDVAFLKTQVTKLVAWVSSMFKNWK